jgi:hypothetical protein
MHLGAAELFRADHFPGRRLHQRRAAQENGALSAHDHSFIGHRGHIRPAGGARAHHAGDLRNAGGREVGDVEEDAAEMLAVGKHVVLLGKVAAARVDEVDARQPVLRRDLLGAQMLLNRHRIVGAALDGGVVRDDHALAPRDAPDTADDRCAVHVAAVHAPGGELADLEERRAGIEQAAHALARQQLAPRDVLVARAALASHGDRGDLLPEVLHQAAHAPCIRAEFGRARVEPAADDRHQKGAPSQRSICAKRSIPQNGSPSTMM